MRRSVPILLATVLSLVLLANFHTSPAQTALSTPHPAGSTSPTTTPSPAAGASPDDPEALGGTSPPLHTSPSTTLAPSASGTRIIDGPAVENRYGPVQVEVTLAGDRIIDVQALQLPSDRAKSQTDQRRRRPEAAPGGAGRAERAGAHGLGGDLHEHRLSAVPPGRPRSGGAALKRVAEIWGTAVSVDVREEVPETLFDEVFAWFGRVDALFSTWRDDSEIVRIARGRLARAQSSPETRTVLDLCEALSLATGGAFDVAATALLSPPYPPGWCRLDPSAVVKGWALDRAADLLTAAGVRRFCLNAGGDVLVGAGPGPGEAWRVGIQHPWWRDQLAEVVEVADTAVATSGRYERGSHIVDPRSGRRATGLASVTVVASDLATADAYSTAILALGSDGLDWLAGHGEVDALVITDGRQVYTTPGFGRRRERRNRGR